jgi:hypothetical protein
VNGGDGDVWVSDARHHPSNPSWAEQAAGEGWAESECLPEVFPRLKCRAVVAK